MTRTLARRLALGVALALACSTAEAQAVTQHGAVQTPGGVQLQIQPGTIFNYACNGGSGGIVGETQTSGPNSGTVCALPGSGGGGGAVTGASGSFVDGWNVTLGAEADAACVSDAGTCTGQALMKRLNQRISSLISAVGSPLQAGAALPSGANVIGGVTQSGTWAVNSTLQAGSNLIGKVGIDQTTPGTTNGVVVNTGNVGGYSAQAAPTITVQAAAYAAGNSEGGLITVNLARTNGGSGTLTNVRLRSAGGATNTVWVYAWSKSPAATCTDKAAYVNANADAPYALPGFPVQVTLSNPGSWETATYGQLTAINAQFKNQDGTASQNVYLCLVTAGAVTPASTSDLSLVVNALQD